MGWTNVPDVLEEVMAKLAAYRRVVVLSGDVHYGHSSEVSYWFRDDAAPARLAQFTSSGMKNVWPENVVILNRTFASFEGLIDLFNPVRRHGWFTNDPAAIRVPEETHLSPAIRLSLLTSPLLLPGIQWPQGTVVERQPDWAWTLQLAADKRPHNKLPGGAKPAALDPENPEADAPGSLEGYRLAARRHAQQLEKTSHTRRLLFASNLGVVTFSRDDEERLTARQELFARPGGSGSAAAFTVHDIRLDAAPEPMPAVEIEQPPT